MTTSWLKNYTSKTITVTGGLRKKHYKGEHVTWIQYPTKAYANHPIAPWYGEQVFSVKHDANGDDRSSWQVKRSVGMTRRNDGASGIKEELDGSYMTVTFKDGRLKKVGSGNSLGLWTSDDVLQRLTGADPNKYTSRMSIWVSIAAFLPLAGVVFSTAAKAQTDNTPANSQKLFAAWPKKPEKFINVKPLVVSGPVDKPIFEHFADDPYSPAKVPSDLNGYLLYTPRVSPPGYPAMRVYSIRSVGSEPNGGDPQGTVAQYPGMDGEGDISEPLFSPNGRSMSYKAGRLGEHSMYQIYVWDFEQRRVVKVTNYGYNVHYPTYYWSPDSSQIAYVLGVDEFGEEGEYGVPSLGIARVSDAKNTYLRGKPTVQLKGQPFFPSLSMVAWSSPQSLIFVQSDQSAKEAAPRSQGNSQGASPLSIYEDSLTPSEPKKIINDAYAPAVSPDSRWIAFLRKLPANDTAPQPQQSLSKPGATAGPKETGGSRKINLPGAEEGVFLYNRDNKKETDTGIRLDKTSRYKYDEALRWTPDSSKLILAEVYAPSPFSENRKSTVEVQVRLVEVAKSKSEKENGTKEETKNFEVRALPKWYVDVPNTTILKLGIKQATGNGRYLVFDQSELAADATGTTSLKQEFSVMDLQAGQVLPVAEFSPVPLTAPTMIGWDWISASDPH